MLIDLHTHQNGNDSISIKNIIAGKQPLTFEPDKKKYYSIGIHPWYPESFEELRDEISETAALPEIKAIGECGLDKSIALPIEKQIEIFIWQIQLAEKLRKPIIIHCVKAYNELLKIKKANPSTIPWIIHGFNASEPILQQCIQENFYFSIGHLLFNSKSNIYKLITIIPREKIFLETDESTIPLKDIYAQYSFITGISEIDVQQMIYTNFVHCFKNSIKRG